MACSGPAEGNDGYYEIQSAGSKGSGAFAVKHIASETRILIDTPLFTIDKDEHQIQDEDIVEQVRALRLSARLQFYALPYLQTVPTPTPNHQTVQKFYLNQFQVRGQRGLSCFVHASRFNHSCLPNCFMTSTKDGKKQCFTGRDIKPGEELTFAYIESYQYMTTAERQEGLSLQFGGLPCKCTVCCLPAKEREVSDMRRRLMRYLVFIVHGKEIPEMPRAIPHDYKAPSFASKSVPAELFTRLAEAEGVEGSSVWNMYTMATTAELKVYVASGAVFMPRNVLNNVGVWMGKAQRMKTKLAGTSGEYLRKDIDDKIDSLVAAVGLLQSADGRLDVLRG